MLVSLKVRATAKEKEGILILIVISFLQDNAWEDPEGVPIDAILFGGRRPEGVPLIYEAFDWNHAVFMGASMRSEATAAAEFKGKAIMHDPFAMRPFVGYNIGE